MKTFWTTIGLFVVACLLVACDTQDIPGTTDDGQVVYCNEDSKADRPGCVEPDKPDTTESPPGDDVWSGEDDTYIEEDDVDLASCVPIHPDGTWVQCGQGHFPCQIFIDMAECTMSCWGGGEYGAPPAAFKAVPQDDLFSPREDGTPWCTPLEGQQPTNQYSDRDIRHGHWKIY